MCVTRVMQPEPSRYTPRPSQRRRRVLPTTPRRPPPYLLTSAPLSSFRTFSACLPFCFVSGATAAAGKGYRQGNEECPDQEPQAPSFTQTALLSDHRPG